MTTIRMALTPDGSNPARCRRAAARLAALALGAGCAAAAVAQQPAQTDAPAPPVAQESSALEGLELSLSPFTYHFHPSDEHEYVYQIGLLKRLKDNWIVGAAYFSNSFGQPSGYVYVGQRYENFTDFERWYLQWNVGVLYGYVGEYKDKVPFNYKGFSPGFVPSIGYKFTDKIYGELDLLGNSALMFTFVFPLSPGR
ncbi:MAG TPA: ABC transporter ATP-binding protein [Burkholderiaceae bacterium]|nr:ABC transporter ATP-binding protein [Burkholderiaceae bacterium]